MWDDARLYDHETADDPEFDLPYWRSLLDEFQSARVLELACGTGRLTLPLARHGRALRADFRIVGLDLSAPLVERARAKLVEAEDVPPDTARFVVGDMRAFDLDDEFDLIVVAFNSLAYIHTLEDQLACLEAARRHLAPAGRLAIDLLVPRLEFLSEAQRPAPPCRLEMDHPVPAEGIGRLLRTYVDRYDAETQTIASTYFYDISYVDGRQERLVRNLDWHMYFHRELLLLLRLAGLRPIARYGGYDRSPFTKRSFQYLWVMEEADSAAM